MVSRFQWPFFAPNGINVSCWLYFELTEDFGLIYMFVLTRNENATNKCTSISQGYIEYTFTEDFGDFKNTKDRHYIDVISFNVKF